MTQRRIALIINTNVGGKWTVPHVDEMVQRGHLVFVFVGSEPGPLANAMRATGATVRQVDFDRRGIKKTFTSWRTIRSSLKANKVDVVVYFLYKAALFGKTTARSLSIPTVHAIVGPIFLEYQPTRALEHLLHRLDSMVLAGSYSAAQSLHSIGRRRDVTVVYPPIDTDHFQPASASDRAAARTTLGIDPAAFVAIMVSYWYAPRKLPPSISDVKGHEMIVRAWMASSRAPGDRLLLVGGGFRQRGTDYRNELMPRLLDMTDGSVVFLDHADDVRLYYRAADVSIAASRSENLGAAAEASAMGVPSITSRVGGFPEMVIPGYTGWLFPLDDPTELVAHINNARTIARTPTISAYGERAREIAVALLKPSTVTRQFCDQVERIASRKKADRWKRATSH
jgi:glycosyltransferase involved in cell wall biosynthesis